MTNDIREMENRRSKSDRAIFQRVGQPLHRPIKVRWRRVSEKKMLEPFRDQSPTADKRVAQDERLIVPDKSVAQRGRVGGEDNESNQQKRFRFFQDKEVEQFAGMRV